MDYSLVGMSVVQDPFKDVSTNVKKKKKKTSDNLLSSFNYVTHVNPDFVGGIFSCHWVGEFGWLSTGGYVTYPAFFEYLICPYALKNDFKWKQEKEEMMMSNDSGDFHFNEEWPSGGPSLRSCFSSFNMSNSVWFFCFPQHLQPVFCCWLPVPAFSCLMASASCCFVTVQRSKWCNKKEGGMKRGIAAENYSHMLTNVAITPRLMTQQLIARARTLGESLPFTENIRIWCICSQTQTHLWKIWGGKTL